MSNYYEDTMPLVTNENDYLKYFIDESLPLFDKLNIIIKKGQPIQRQALLNNMSIYIKSSLFKPLIQFIISEIETWDIETLLLFPKCLHNLLIKNFSSLDNELFNIIFKHIIISISSGNEKLSKEYIYYFDIVVVHFTKEFNINNGKKFPFVIDDNIYEIIFSLGKFGQTPENYRLCCYLASCMCRIMGNEEDNINIQKMYDRICFLFSDLEKTTETQISRELKYLIPIFKEKILEKNNIIQAIKSYINHDFDHIIQSTTIISLLTNIKYISVELKELIVEKINEIFDDNNYEDEYKNTIVDTVINSLYNECLEYESKYIESENNNNSNNNNSNENNINSDKEEIYRMVNKILDMNFMKNFFNNDKIEPLLIINFDKISLIFKYYTNNCNENSLYCNSCDDDIMSTDDLFIKIYSKIFPKNVNNNSININFNNSINANTSFAKEEKKENIENLKKYFILYLYKIIPCLNSLNNTKILYEKINNIFKKDSIISTLKNFENEFTSNNNSKNYNYLYKLLLSLLRQSHNIITNNNNTNININKSTNISNNTNTNTISHSDNYYIKLFNNILNVIFSYYNQCPKLFTSQIHFLIAKTLQKIIKQIYKYNKCFSQSNNKDNKDKNIIDKIYDDIYNNFLYNIIKNQNLGNHIKIEYINIFPYLILYGKNRQTYLSFLEEEIIKSTHFYTRRYSINIIEKCLKIYSFTLFIKLNLLDIVHNLVNDENNIISASTIEKILLFHKKIIVSSKEVFMNICKTLSTINKLNKNSLSVSIRNFDIEKNRTIKKILNLGVDKENNNWDENYEEEIKKIKEKETKLISREIEVFGKGYQSLSMNVGFFSNRRIFNYENKADLLSINFDIKNPNCADDSVGKVNFTQNNKSNKRKSLIEKSNSGIIQNLSSKNNSKKYLPKIKHNSRKYSSSNNRQCDITFNNNNNMINNNNINVINKINSKTLNINKLIISFKDKSSEKKCNLKSINANNNSRLPSANSIKMRESLPCNINRNIIAKNLFNSKPGNNIFIDDNNLQVLNSINRNSLGYNFMRLSGRIVIKDLLNNNNNDYSNNIINVSESIHSSKNIKSGLKVMKMKKDNYFNISNKITINAKTNEINKSNK